MCTKTSLPPLSGWMNPYPFVGLNHFTVPIATSALPVLIEEGNLSPSDSPPQGKTRQREPAGFDFVSNQNMQRAQKITIGEVRSMGVRGLLVYCADYKCAGRSTLAVGRIKLGCLIWSPDSTAKLAGATAWISSGA
jgi:hypothetical protein